jgi:hypothetical protein
VFKGSAWLRDEDGDWDEVGWARIYLKRDGSKPWVEGVFSMLGDHHHIQLRSSYLQIRRRSDVNLQDSEDEYMVVYRDSDMAGEEHSDLELRSPGSVSCAVDELDFNHKYSHRNFRL